MFDAVRSGRFSQPRSAGNRSYDPPVGPSPCARGSPAHTCVPCCRGSPKYMDTKSSVLLSEPGLHHFVYVPLARPFHCCNCSLQAPLLSRQHFRPDKWTLFQESGGNQPSDPFWGKNISIHLPNTASVQPRVIIVNNN